MTASTRLRFAALAGLAVLGIGAPRLSAIDPTDCDTMVLQAKSPEAEAKFGWSVDADGKWLVGGGPFTSSGGAIAMFEGTSHERVLLPAPRDLQDGDHFGFSVSIHGNWLAVGSPSGDGSVRDSGVVYLFYNADGTSTWEQKAKLEANDAARGAEFGFSVALSANTLVVGAPSDSDRGTQAGSAFVFVFDPQTGSWTQTVELHDVDRGQPFDRFGSSVAVDGKTLVVGAPFADDFTRSLNFGAAYVFGRDDQGRWPRIEKLTAGTFRDGNIQFGAAVAIYEAEEAVGGDLPVGRIAVGAPGDDHSGLGSGTAFVFSLGSWNRQELMHEGPGTGEQFGTSVDINATHLAVGAPFDDGGAAYLFEGESREPTLKYAQAMPGSFGQSVALLGKTVYPGGPSYSNKAGAIAVCLKRAPILQCETEGPPSPVVAGANVTYKIKVSNTGSATANGLELIDPKPILSLVPQPGQLCKKGFPCPLDPLDAGESLLLKVKFKVVPIAACGANPGPIDDVIKVSATGVPRITCTPVSPPGATTIEVPKAGKLECKITSPSISVKPGDEITYTVRVNNTGCEKVRDVLFDNPVPDGLSFLSVAGHRCSDLRCRLGMIEPGGFSEVVARFQVRDVPLDSVEDIAHVTGTGGTAATCSLETVLRGTEIQAEGSIQEIPALSEEGALALILLLAFLTLRRLRSA